MSSEDHGSPISQTAYSTIRDNSQSDDQPTDAGEEIRWREHKAILRRAAEELANRRAKAKAAVVGNDDSFLQLDESLEYGSAEACSNAIRSLYDLDPDRAASFFNLALRESSPERRRKIGAALTASGLVSEAIENLAAAKHENSYSSFSLLFLVAKAGEVQPLTQIIESHPNMELRLAVLRLLAASGEPDILPVLQRLAVNNLPSPVRSAITEAINQLVQHQTESSAA
jgi:hypothetical protein